jgi:glycosyltransferase involved in cell wall biosynthesis
MTRLIWHAILKNEAAILPRCLASIIPYVDAAIIADTGSDDGTPALVRQAFEAAGKPVEVHHIEFRDFSQARNEALTLARSSALSWDWALLSDADMELKVERSDRTWLRPNGGMAYDVEQVAGSTRYWNRRVLARAATGIYRSPTHEFLDIPSGGRLSGVWFCDHADGANRPLKLTRDIILLQEALRIETNPGLMQRYHFYIGQSYYDLGQWEKASEYYRIRAGLGGYAEEAWYAQYRYALCMKHLGRKYQFVYGMLQAYEMRPQRAESRYELAKFYREMGGGNQRSLLFSESFEGELVKDSLFVDTYAYYPGIAEEFSICAYYGTPTQRSMGFSDCNVLALDRTIPWHTREQARHNMFWYLQPLSEHVLSFHPVRIPFEPEEGWVAMNPSIVALNGGVPLVLLRTVNYRITPEGRYVSRMGDVGPGGVPVIRTRNFILSLDLDRSVAHASELQLPDNLPVRKFDLVCGFEDSRLFEWQGKLWTLSTVREFTPEGWCEIILAPIDSDSYGSDWRRVVPDMERRHEKNWMPWPRSDGALDIVYRLGTVIDIYGNVVRRHESTLDIDHISGGSQVIEVGPDQYLAVVHEARPIPYRKTRYYSHRFVLLRGDGSVVKLSEPFYFHGTQIEFCAGLALIGKRLVVSYGVRDEEAWTATMNLDEVLEFIE